jgi:hypothetical protein
MFDKKIVRKSKSILCSEIFFSRKFYYFWDNVKNYDTARQATDDTKTRRKRDAVWLSDS